MSPEIAALHRPVKDLKLKEGETIHVNIKSKLTAPKKAQAPVSGPRIIAPPPTTETKSEPGIQNWATFD